MKKQYIVLMLSDLFRELRLASENRHPPAWETDDKISYLAEGFTHIKREVPQSNLIRELYR